MTAQPPLFDLPSAPKPPRPRRKPRSEARTRYARHVPRWRRLCDLCIADIHRRGVQRAPLPGAVRWRRTDEAGDVTLLCERHKCESETGDE